MRREETSRRRFLRKTVLGAATAATVGFVEAEPAQETESHPERKRLERLIARYGSELGDLRKAGR